jgi:hypothetical protein
MRTLFMSLVLTLACAGAAAAQQAPVAPQPPTVLSKVYACAAIADPQARLACFDAEVASLKTAESEGQFAAVDANRAQQIQRESFGFYLPSLPQLGLPRFRRAAEGGPAEESFDSQSMRIARLGRFDGRDSFVMENGQVWVQIDTEKNRKAEAGAAVTIRKASLGSFLMSVEAGGRAVRVRRAQ